MHDWSEGLLHFAGGHVPQNDLAVERSTDCDLVLPDELQRSHWALVDVCLGHDLNLGLASDLPERNAGVKASRQYLIAVLIDRKTDNAALGIFKVLRWGQLAALRWLHRVSRVNHIQQTT